MASGDAWVAGHAVACEHRRLAQGILWGMRSIIDFYRFNPARFAIVLVVAVVLAALVLGLGSGSALQVIALGLVGGLVAGLVIAGLRGRREG